MTFELILTGPDHLKQKARICRKNSIELQTYKKNIIRFIFDCYVTNQHGAVLHIDLHMNHEHACAVAIDALYQRGMQNVPSVVLCSESRLSHWFYFMKKYSHLDVFKVTENNIERLLARQEAIVLIATEKEHAVLRQYVKDVQFFFLIADQVDLLCEKLIVRQIQAEFHLGVTHRNFIIDPDQQLRWKITNWALMKLNKQFAKLSDFIEYDNAYLQIRVDPYTAFWLAITWELCSPADRSQCEEDKGTLLANIERYAHEFGLQTTDERSKPKRRTAANNSATQNANKRKRLVTRRTLEPEPCFDHWTSDEDMPPDLSAFETSTASLPRDSPKKLRLKSPKCKKQPVDDFNSSFVDLERCTKSSSQTLRKTKSARAILFDQEVIEEFSKPFECNPPRRSTGSCTLQTTKSDSAVITPGARNVRLPKDPHEPEELAALNALCDVDVLREFSSHFEATSSAKAISQQSLQSLLTGEIVTSQGNTCTRCGSKKSSQEDPVDELSLRLSDDSIDEQLCNLGNTIEETYSTELPRSEQAKNTIVSSDDELDNYMSQIIASMKQANKLNPKTTTHFKFLDATSNDSRNIYERELDDTSTNMLTGDSDSDNYLRDIIKGRTCVQDDVPSNAHVNFNSDSQEDNYLLSFL